MDNKLVGQRIREARKARRITQKELGAAISRTESSVAKYEQGLVEIPTSQLQRIASALGIHVYDLMAPEQIMQQTDGGGVDGLDEETQYKGIVDMLIELYGAFEEKSIESQAGCGCYYLVGKGENQFILEYEDLEKITSAAKASIPPIVDAVKCTIPEAEYVKAFLKASDDISTKENKTPADGE